MSEAVASNERVTKDSEAQKDFAKHREAAFLEVKHGVTGGALVSFVVSMSHWISWMKHADATNATSFFAHLSGGLDPAFILGGFALASVLLFFTGAEVNGWLFRNMVKPWLSLVIHSASWVAGAAFPLALLALAEKQWRIAVALFPLGTIVGVAIALLATCLLIGANPALIEDGPQKSESNQAWRAITVDFVSGMAGKVTFGLLVAGFVVYYFFFR